jgi:hypothetical protein
VGGGGAWIEIVREERLVMGKVGRLGKVVEGRHD